MTGNCYKAMESADANTFLAGYGIAPGYFFGRFSNCRLNGDGTGPQDIGPIRSPYDFVRCMDNMGVDISDTTTWAPIYILNGRNDNTPEGICFALAHNHGEIECPPRP